MTAEVASADDLAAEALTLARQALADVGHLHVHDGTRIFTTAAVSTTIAILAARAELREQQKPPPAHLDNAVHHHVCDRKAPPT